MSEPIQISQIEMCAAIAAELSRQHPGITCGQADMNRIIQAANVVCDGFKQSGVVRGGDEVLGRSVSVYSVDEVAE